MTPIDLSPTLIIGTGLVGASVGLALSRAGVTVHLSDRSSSHARVAASRGAGTTTRPDPAAVRLVVVAVPPDALAGVVERALATYPNATVTDVGSVKGTVLAALRSKGLPLDRYVGSHPMAGRERSGPSAAVPDLFLGRPWVIAQAEESAPQTVLAVRALAVDLGAVPVTMDADAHDAAVAAVSHVPQVVSSLVAARLVGVDDAALGLAGQGLRDVTRIAASDPELWTSILAANSAAVRPLLEALRGDLDEVIDALASADEADGPETIAAGVLVTLARAIAAGNEGVARIPGKHGGAQRPYEEVTVLVPDSPGELARLLTEIGEAGVNLEDLRLEHAAGRQVGMAAISVLPGSAARLEAELVERGWRLVV